ncbi:MAG: RT0821/Lpp0805 family surface protein [Rickettsiales bacterium]|nr:RT0821/Lpp0805 family surface protein [Rickettsiales bacterium]
MNFKNFSLICASLLFVACQNQHGGGFSKADVGTVAGAALGAWAGHNIGGGSGQVVATAAGTLLGAAIGREVGASLDNGDLAIAESTSQRALETAQPGETLPWSNPQTGHSGSVTPSNYYQTAQGRYCREYTQTIQVGGKEQQGYGTACRQPDGSWEIVE